MANPWDSLVAEASAQVDAAKAAWASALSEAKAPQAAPPRQSPRPRPSGRPRSELYPDALGRRILYGRNIEVEVGDRQTGRGVLIRELRVDFSFRYSVSDLPKGQVKIYNPSPDTLDVLRTTRPFVRVSAGYEFPRALFTGSPFLRGVEEARDNVDTVITLDIQGGRADLTTAVYTGPASANPTLAEVARAAIRQAGMAPGTLDLPNLRVPRGPGFGSSPWIVIQDVARRANVEIAVDENTVHLIDRTRETERVVAQFSSRTGNLIGTMRQTDYGVRFRGLLDGRVRPGRPCVVESLNRRSRRLERREFRAREVAFVGSNWSNDFYVDVEAWTSVRNRLGLSPPLRTVTFGRVTSAVPDGTAF